MLIDKEKNFISAVVYVNDDESLIDDFCSCLYGVMESSFEKYEIIFVNDASTDSSISKIRDFSHKHNIKAVSIINMSIYQGIELAMNAGVDLAIGDFVFEFDSVSVDYDKSKIMEVYHHSLKGHDIVSASPEKPGHISSWLFYTVFNKFSTAKYSLRTERFRILSRRAINRVQSLSKTISYRKAAYAASGLKIDHLFYKSTIRECNISRERLQTRKRTAFDSLIIYTHIAYKISIYLTLILLSFTVLAGIYTVVIYLWIKKPIEGWTTIMILLSGGFSGVFLVLAIIIKYLSILVELVLKKQKYLIESIEKLS